MVVSAPFIPLSSPGDVPASTSTTTNAITKKETVFNEWRLLKVFNFRNFSTFKSWLHVRMETKSQFFFILVFIWLAHFTTKPIKTTSKVIRTKPIMTMKRGSKSNNYHYYCHWGSLQNIVRHLWLDKNHYKLGLLKKKNRIQRSYRTVYFAPSDHCGLWTNISLSRL